MAERFPKDCWEKNCPHFHTKDLSIDDLVCTCDLLKIQCDACDEDFCLYLCPLPNEPKERRCGVMDYKEYARQLRENAAKDDNGVIRCSPELWEEIARIIENSEEVKHGEWIETKEWYFDEYAQSEYQRKCYECSICKRTEQYKEPYCHCGAKMDGGKTK